ncbi:MULTISPECIES: phosphopantetheine-binding protein [unclassified Streptomyces]|uniref:phosphopantetheine-binding protein n=1 Tax=unclassified Streptomyces TaxID=2593676 RepID=UPI002DD941C2|nr:phosphopantetheine-binding protein [Streptomyces sp. NBC_00243]WRZ17319.1 phosphopantetheine-binding protein [Streptomyces sp. NBC_00243]
MASNTTGEPSTLDQLREAVAEILHVEPQDIPADANLVHLGVDSLGMMRLVTRWRRQGIRLSSRELMAQPTMAAWQQHIDTLRQQSAAEQPRECPGHGAPPR